MHTKTLTATDVQALFDQTIEAWNRADAHALAELYAPHGRLVIPFGEELDGRERIAAGFAEHFQGLLAETTTTIEVTDVRDLGNGLAFVDATQEVSGPMPTLHVAAVVRRVGETAQIVECRPYAFLPDPRLAPA